MELGLREAAADEDREHEAALASHVAPLIELGVAGRHEIPHPLLVPGVEPHVRSIRVEVGVGRPTPILVVGIARKPIPEHGVEETVVGIVHGKSPPVAFLRSLYSTPDSSRPA